MAEKTQMTERDMEIIEKVVELLDELEIETEKGKAFFFANYNKYKAKGCMDSNLIDILIDLANLKYPKSEEGK